jgi:uncharacterized repeat protein (TIGR03803 family)
MKNLHLRQAIGLTVLSLFVTTIASLGRADTLKTIYAFGSFADGAGPDSNLIFVNGMIYGNTESGGVGCTELAGGCGTLFQLDPATGAETVLHSFLFAPDGGFPEAGPLYVNGVFYGATQQGGADYGGSVYAYNPVTSTESVIVNFSGANGVNPGLGSIAAHNGIVYGVTSQGGEGGRGTIYKLDTVTGKQTVLYSFFEGPGGYEPQAGVLYQDGFLYGTTSAGGSKKESICHYGCGTLYKFDLATKVLTVLFGFKDRRSGGFPYRETVIYHDGALYGVTLEGGAIHKPNCVHITGCGVVYKFDLASNEFSVLHRFTGGHDGYYPQGGLVYVGGFLYGITTNGGFADRGTVYKVNATTGAKTLLHSFSLMGAKDGTQPFGGMTYFNGKLYGTTTSGGNLKGQCSPYGCGTIFELSP